MKINRTKRAQKHLQFYSNHFGFREPYQVLIDGTFCFNALKSQFKIVDQIQKYFQKTIKPLTTACCIIESEGLGSKFQSTTQLLKEFKVHKCGHEKRPLTGSACMKSMVGKSHYILATQDRDLQEWVRLKSGIPLVYLHQVAPTLDPPSEASQKAAERQTSKVLDVSKLEGERISFYKKKEGLIQETQESMVRKKKRKGGPNPLSCKKKKSNDGKTEISTNKRSGKVDKRKRIKVPKHVKELLKTKQIG